MNLKALLFLLVICLGCGVTDAKDKKDDALHKFETEAWDLRTDLLHNHTYELSNLKKADSLYKKSVEMKSTLGKLYALQIRTYALVGNDRKKEFLKTVDEYIKLALDNEYYDQYFDAVSAKTQFLMSNGEYNASLFEAKDMFAVAEKHHNLDGIYSSNLMLGQIYNHRSSWIAAEKHLLMALDAIRKGKTNDSIHYCLVYLDLSECCSGASKHTEAIDYALKARQWANYDMYRYFADWTYFKAIYESGDMARFRREYAKSPLRLKEVRDQMPEDMVNYLLVMTCVANGKFEEGRRILSEMKVGEEKNNLLYSSLYYHEGNYKKAYEYLLKQQMRVDSVETVMQQSELEEMEKRLVNANMLIESEEMEKQHRLIIAVSIGTLLLFVICTMFYMLARRRRQNRVLAEINKAMEQKNRELVKAEAATKQALVKVKQANDMRSRFIENMMHEIRTPLNAISGFTQILTSSEYALEDESASEMREGIITNTENLTNMLDQIIHLSSFDSGSENINVAETTLSEIVDKAVAQCTNIKEGVQLIVNTQDATLTTDAHLAAEALTMLLFNAGKFTHKGTITIDATKTGDTAIIAVTDTGIGIPHDKAEKIFDRFYKIDEFIPGTGLGLSLCRAITTSLHGTVTLDTTHQSPGSRFVITLSSCGMSHE